MPKPEGKVFDFFDIDVIDPDFLETVSFENEENEKIIIESDEFSAVCPFSGLPDIGKIVIEYVPNKHIIELKSLKYYLTSFRQAGVYQEQANKIIFNDLFNVLKPKKMKVDLIYNIRGGMLTTTSIDSENIKPE